MTQVQEPETLTLTYCGTVIGKFNERPSRDVVQSRMQKAIYKTRGRVAVATLDDGTGYSYQATLTASAINTEVLSLSDVMEFFDETMEWFYGPVDWNVE